MLKTYKSSTIYQSPECRGMPFYNTLTISVCNNTHALNPKIVIVNVHKYESFVKRVCYWFCVSDTIFNSVYSVSVWLCTQHTAHSTQYTLQHSIKIVQHINFNICCFIRSFYCCLVRSHCICLFGNKKKEETVCALHNTSLALYIVLFVLSIEMCNARVPPFYNSKNDLSKCS